MKTHQASIPYSGDSQSALNSALQTLLPLGFQIESQGSSHLIVSNHNTGLAQQYPLLGVSRAEFNAGHSSLSVSAELGGVERSQRMLLLILLGSGVFDAIMLTLLWYFIESLRVYTWFLAFPLASLLIWPIVAPHITRWAGQRTLDALDGLLSEMAGNP